MTSTRSGFDVRHALLLAKLPADQEELRRSADIADEQLDRVRIPLDTAVIFATAKVGTKPCRYSRNCEGDGERNGRQTRSDDQIRHASLVLMTGHWATMGSSLSTVLEGLGGGL